MDMRIGANNLSPADFGKMPGGAKDGFPNLDRVLDGAGQTPTAPAGASSLGPNFMDTLADAVHAVQGLQADAGGKVQQMLTGTEGGELHSTIIAVEKADLAFQLMMQVRNKIVAAYQEVARMPF